MLLQVLAQRDVIGEQNERCRDLEASTRQLEERCSELKEASGGHEARAREEAAEVLKGNRIIEKLTVRDNADAAVGLQLVCPEPAFLVDACCRSAYARGVAFGSLTVSSHSSAALLMQAPGCFWAVQSKC